MVITLVIFPLTLPVVVLVFDLIGYVGTDNLKAALSLKERELKHEFAVYHNGHSGHNKAKSTKNVLPRSPFGGNRRVGNPVTELREASAIRLNLNLQSPSHHARGGGTDLHTG